ncbi:MAG: carboxynorspermidine decarboxylase [Candidatus Thiodiazotropha sp.]
MQKIRTASGCQVLYSIKACPFTGLLKRMRGQLDGFSVSSLFEARLAHEVLAGKGTVHITTPGLRRDEIAELGELCDTISFNSLNQLQRLPFLLGGRAKVGLRINPQRSFLHDSRYDPCRAHSKLGGLRINPQRSFLHDSRYDPCRAHSKLGVPLPQVVESYRSGRLTASGLSGLHLHNNFSASSFTPLQETVQHLETQLPQLVREIEWINLGGGYLFQQADDLPILLATIDHIQSVWGAQVFLEPGKAIIDDTGFLVASVIDTFESDGKAIAVLDTSVNHLPEVFEYQTRPQLLNEAEEGRHTSLLAGSTCLSGDLFGEYRFDKPLQINDRVVFGNVGAYSLIKATRFNGYNLPSLYLLDSKGEVRLMKDYDYDDYRRQWSETELFHQTSKIGAG